MSVNSTEAELARLRELLTEACVSLDEAGYALLDACFSFQDEDWIGNVAGFSVPMVGYLKPYHKMKMDGLSKSALIAKDKAATLRALIDEKGGVA